MGDRRGIAIDIVNRYPINTTYTATLDVTKVGSWSTKVGAFWQYAI